MDILIKNSRLVDENINVICDIYIENGIIREIGNNLEKQCKIIDGKNLVTMPAFIDLHVHFRDPGYTEKEDLETGSKAALKGGYTTVNLMGNTKPIASNMEVVNYVLDKSKKLDLIDIHQTVSLTKNFDGKTLNHLEDIDRDKVKFISDDGFGVISNKVSYEAMKIAKKKDFVIMTHAEDMELTPISYRLSENIITGRDLCLSDYTGAKLHLSHVSTKEAIKAIRKSKEKNINITCEVTPHHIALWDNDYKVNPPIRERADVNEIIKGLQDGTVDTIATDHAPHTEEDKTKGAPGISGIETAFSICYSSLVKRGFIDLSKLSKVMSANGARIMDINKGRLEEGFEADVVLIDLDKKRIINGKKFISKGKNTPLNGEEVYGEIVMTIKGGNIKYENPDYSLI